ncbi:MAG TPA: energy transducer TonB [Lacunisphaera sp.]|nr:energy transducer TonB [Lacunisphaera sp.]
MKIKSIVLTAAVLVGLSVSAHAVTTEAHGKSAAAAAVKFEAPAPTKVVQPMGLSRRLEGATVTLRFTVDEAGKPHDIRVLAPHDGALTRNLVSAVSQWEFTPGRKNGRAVSTHVELPIQLVDS